MQTTGAVMVKELLEAAIPPVAVFAAVTGWALFIGQEPEARTGKAPETVVTLYDTGGDNPNPKWAIDEPSVQVRVRGAANGYVAASDKAQEVKNVLLGHAADTIVGGATLVGVWMNGDVNFIGTDDSNRPLFTLNFRLVIEPPITGTNRAALG